MASPIATRSQRSETADLVTVIVLGVLTTIVIASGVVGRLWSAFREGGFASRGVTGEPLHPLDFWNYAPLWLIGVAMGILAVAFRRGIRLQRDTEGLV